MTDDADPSRGLPSENRRPWYEAYAGRPWLAALAGSVAGVALLFVGVALGGGNREHVVPVSALAAAIIGGIIALGQLQVARKRHEEQTKADLRRHDAQTKADFQRRVTESFTKAVEQLGSEHLPVRVGGIYALERISRESEEDYWTVMETLTAFVRERARWKEPNTANITSEEEQYELPTDVTAVIAVVGRRQPQDREHERVGGLCLDLRSTDLRGISLARVHLKGANFKGSNIERTIFMEAHLERASFIGAHLQRAFLEEAHLEEAYFHNAHLEMAFLKGAHLEQAFLTGAYLKGADFRKAHLEGADLLYSIGLTQNQIHEAYGDTKTRLPSGIKRPDHWT